MDHGSLRRFARRDWKALAASKTSYWAARAREAGGHPTWDAAQALLAHARAVRPEFPTDEERRRDFASHLALRERLDRVAHAVARR